MSSITAEYLAALEVERDGYRRTGRVDRAKAVDAEIVRVKRALGQEPDEPPKQAQGKPQRVERRGR